MQTPADQILVTNLPLEPSAVLWLRQAARESQTILVMCRPPRLPEPIGATIEAINEALREEAADEELDALIAAAMTLVGRYYGGPVGVELGPCSGVSGLALLLFAAADGEPPATVSRH